MRLSARKSWHSRWLLDNFPQFFSTIELIFLIIQQFFAVNCENLLGLARSEREFFKKTASLSQKTATLSFLAKWLKRKPEDFAKNPLTAQVLQEFLQFLRKIETEDVLQRQIFKSCSRFLRKKRDFSAKQANLLENYAKIASFSRETAKKLVLKLPPADFARILFVLDAKSLIKADILQEISAERRGFFEEMLAFSQKNARFLELARLLFQSKDYMSLFPLFQAISCRKCADFLEKDLVFYQKLFENDCKILRQKLKHHFSENDVCIPAVALYSQQIAEIDRKYCSFQKKDCVIFEQLAKKSAVFEEFRGFQRRMRGKVREITENCEKNAEFFAVKRLMREFREKP